MEKEKKEAWADVAQKEEEEEAEAEAEAKREAAEKAKAENVSAAVAASSSSSSAAEEPNIGDLSIGDAESSKPQGIENADDSQIQVVTAGDTIYSSASTFKELNLPKELLLGLYLEMGFEKPSKIQAISLPLILTPPYRSLVAQAHNGSGKTACFVIGMLSRVNPNEKNTQALCICPTRELAVQNQEVLMKMGKHMGVTSACAVTADAGAARRGPVFEHVVIGTPGTLNNWINRKLMSKRFMKILVFDEADHMLAEDGFKYDSTRIMREIKKDVPNVQVLLFSATFNETVKDFASKVAKDGNQIFVKKEDLSLDSIKQFKVHCPDEVAKLELLRDRVFSLAGKLNQAIIFVRTRASAVRVHQTLTADGWECTAITGQLEPSKRERLIQEFRSGLTGVLITTDILARGFDQQEVNVVVNFDLPVKHSTQEPDYEVYLHRIGRAGRFGRKGAAINLICTERDERIMAKIEEYFKHEVIEIPVWNSDESFTNALKVAGLY